MNQMRELFEAQFPLPEGVAWKDSGNYGVVGKGTRAMLSASSYRAMWQVWQAAQSAAVPVVGKHPSHVTRASDASSFDEICINCGAKDTAGAGWGDLANPCNQSVPVVGEVVYIRKDKLQRVQQFGPSLCEIYTTPAKAGLVPLIVQPTTSITAAELSDLIELVISAQGYTDEKLLNLMKRVMP